MSVLDKIYSDNLATALPSLTRITWCEEDHHSLYEYFADFNDWLDGDDGLDVRIRYRIVGLSNPSKALFVSDLEAYNQVFKAFRNERRNQVLGAEYIRATFGDDHWFDRNTERFEQLIEALKEGAVVPFIGAGISVESGFPTWKGHLLQQGRTSGLDPDHVSELLNAGAYEAVIEEIEASDRHDAFIQEIKDVFSKTGAITQTTLRLTELFTDTIITTNYDHVIEQAFDTGEGDEIQLLESSNILDPLDVSKTTIIKLHGDVRHPANCIISKDQYDLAYGKGELDLSKAIPKVLSFHYRTSNLLFLGCSLSRDRTMEVFRAVKKELKDKDRPQHFSLESMPDDATEVANRNAYLLNLGITPIWFPKGSYDYVEQILRLAKNEMRYRGHAIGFRKPQIVESDPEVSEIPQQRPPKTVIDWILEFLGLLK